MECLDFFMTKTMSTVIPRTCAKDGCHLPIMTENAVMVQLNIGEVVVYLCAEHFAEYLRRTMTKDE